MDDADLATLKQEQEEALRCRSNPAGKELPRTGLCHWCEKAIDGKAVFCDLGCSEEYQKFNKLRR